MRAIFMGTPEIALPALEELSRRHDVVGVVCQPDRPAGRGLEVQPPPVKKRALELGLEVIQPTKIRTPDFLAWMRERQADFAAVLAYGRILPPDVLQAPRLGCFNLHASILPRYRGAAPIQWAIVRGEKETGVSLMQMDPGLDTGPVFAIRKIPIAEEETAGQLAERIAALAAEVVALDLPEVLGGRLQAVPQRHEEATLAPILKKEDGLVDWTKTAAAVHDHVRGMSPWPGAFTRVGPKSMKVLATRKTAFERGGAAPGTVLVADSDGVIVACGDGAVELVRAQMEGKKPLAGRDLANGRALERGSKLG